jgi:glutamine amidotransferase
MQLLFEESDEGPGRGLALLSGRVSKLSGACVPHMGWTKVSDAASPMYFAHGYECTPADFQTVRSVAYFEGRPLVASVRVANTVGLQFHPEKSSAAGLTYLAGVVREVLA